VKKKEEERKHGLEEHGVIFTKPELKPNGNKKEEEMEPRLEGAWSEFCKTTFFLGDKEDVRGEGWYIQIFKAYVTAHVAILKLKSAENKGYNCHAPVLGYKGNANLSAKNKHFKRKRAFTTYNLNLLPYYTFLLIILYKTLNPPRETYYTK
jgi:hypothetical protein